MPLFVSQIHLDHADNGVADAPATSKLYDKVSLSAFLDEWRERIADGVHRQARERRQAALFEGSAAVACEQPHGASAESIATLVGNKGRAKSARTTYRRSVSPEAASAVFNTQYRADFTVRPELAEIGKRFNKVHHHKSVAQQNLTSPRIPFVVPGHEATPESEAHEKFMQKRAIPAPPLEAGHWMSKRPQLTIRRPHKDQPVATAVSTTETESTGRNNSRDKNAELPTTVAKIKIPPKEKVKKILTPDERILLSARSERQALNAFHQTPERTLPPYLKEGVIPHPPAPKPLPDDVRVFPLSVYLPTTGSTFSERGPPPVPPSTTVREGYPRTLGRRKQFHVEHASSWFPIF